MSNILPTYHVMDLRLMAMEKTDRLFWIITGLLGSVVTVAAALIFGSAPPPQASGGVAARETASARKQETQKPRRQSSRFSLSAVIKRNLIFAKVQGDSAFKRLGEPRPGEWLWSFREPGQTLDDYAHTVTNRKTASRDTLHLQPFSDLTPVHRRTLGHLEEFIGVYFQTRVKRLAYQVPTRSWWVRGREQYDADRIVRHLAARAGPRSLGLFGVLGKDMFSGNLNFVFGLALLHDRASVHSLKRYGDEPKTLLRHTLKLSAHELGHVFGIKHCVFYRCIMNGANSLEEGASAPMHLCPVCLAKLKWNVDFDARRRYLRLARFYRKVGMKAEERFVTARAAEVAE